MAEHTGIAWTDSTFNPWRGCTKVSAGCDHCYADTWSKRNPKTLGVWGPDGARVIASESYWQQPFKWNHAAEAAGVRRRVFCASLADVFEGRETMPAEAWEPVQAARIRLWETIDHTPHLDWLLLTKRPQNVMCMVPERWYRRCTSIGEPKELPRNVWIGTSVEDQAAANERIPHLLTIPARVRFLSCEPLLGPVRFSKFGALHTDPPDYQGLQRRGVDWVIAGGESGPNARPMHPDWVRSLRDQCKSAEVPFFFKQWGEYGPVEPNHRPLITRVGGEDVIGLARIGKKAAGRLLDGREWNEFPENAHLE